MIGGLQKMTLLDYPGKVACTVFFQGCNYRCPFCHNSELLPGKGEPAMTREALLAFLEKRRGLLDGVCVTGGEPTLQPELAPLLERIKALGYSVKLDTNGSRPEVLEALAEKGLVDYVAMDVKNGPDRYAETLGLSRWEREKTERSLRFLLSGAVDYELRTTVVKPLHTAGSLEQMGAWLGGLVPGKKPRALYLQYFVDRDTVIFDGLEPPAAEEMEQYARILGQYVEKIAVRGG